MRARRDRYGKSAQARANNRRTFDLRAARVVSAPDARHTLGTRSNWRLIGQGSGIHWPELDGDVSVENLLAGRAFEESRRSLKRWLAQRALSGSRQCMAARLLVDTDVQSEYLMGRGETGEHLAGLETGEHLAGLMSDLYLSAISVAELSTGGRGNEEEES